jgi:transcriptional regulator with XRE-family HTH domain
MNTVTAFDIYMNKDRSREATLLKGYYNTAKLSNPKLRQQQIADALGASQSMVAAWLNDHARCPDASLIKLGEILGFDPESVRPDIHARMGRNDDPDETLDKLHGLIDRLDSSRRTQVLDYIRFILHSRN